MKRPRKPKEDPLEILAWLILQSSPSGWMASEFARKHKILMPRMNDWAIKYLESQEKK